MTTPPRTIPPAMRRLATQIHTTCLRTLLDAYEQAASDGLCAEGAWEVAVAQLRALNLDALLNAQVEQHEAQS